MKYILAFWNALCALNRRLKRLQRDISWWSQCRSCRQITCPGPLVPLRPPGFERDRTLK